MDLARTKRKLSLILIVYSNKIENRVNLSGDGNKSGKKKSIGIISKKKRNKQTKTKTILSNYSSHQGENEPS